MTDLEKEEILLHLKNKDYSKINIDVEFNHINTIVVNSP